MAGDEPDRTASAGRPLRSLRLAPPPKEPGGGWEGPGTGFADGNRTAPDAAPPSPGLSPPNCRGERRIRSRYEQDRTASAGRPLRSLRLAPPPKNPGGGWVGPGTGFVDGNRTAPDTAPPLPASPPRTAGGRGEFDPAPEGASHLPPPRSLRGRAGEGGGPPSRPTPSESPRTQPHTQPPPGFFGGGGRVVPARRGRRAEPSGAHHILPTHCTLPRHAEEGARPPVPFPCDLSPVPCPLVSPAPPPLRSRCGRSAAKGGAAPAR